MNYWSNRLSRTTAALSSADANLRWTPAVSLQAPSLGIQANHFLNHQWSKPNKVDNWEPVLKQKQVQRKCSFIYYFPVALQHCYWITIHRAKQFPKWMPFMDQFYNERDSARQIFYWITSYLSCVTKSWFVVLVSPNTYFIQYLVRFK